MNKIVLQTALFLIVVAIGLVVFAYSKTWGKAELLIKIHINEELVQKSAFGESPTFALWLENPETSEIKTIFVTRRISENDWEGKAEVPVALPFWSHVQEKVKNIPAKTEEVDVVTGATPKPGYFTVNAMLPPESKWTCWIEVNLAGDFNEFYKQVDLEKMKEDTYLSGQPAILYKTEIEMKPGLTFVPEITGMSILGNEAEIVQALQGITTAQHIFDEIVLSVQKPKPKIISK